MATVLQKALNEHQVKELVEGNKDRVSGFVLNAVDVAPINDPALLFQAHGLGFAGSPWRDGAPYLDVLRFAAPPTVYVHAPTAPDFVDRPPFTGTGLAAWDGGSAPLYFIDEVRLPPGAELWRIHRDASEELIALYGDVASGWTALPDNGFGAPQQNTPASVMGWTAIWNGYRLSADLVDGASSVVLAASREPPADAGGFEKTSRGTWRKKTSINEVTDVFELLGKVTYQGAPFRLVDVGQDAGRRLFRLFYTGHNADQAEAMGLTKSDAGVYWTVVDESTVENVEFLQNRMAGLPGAD
ncbi:hypothetical protein [Arthrobacter monumenti]